MPPPGDGDKDSDGNDAKWSSAAVASSGNITTMRDLLQKAGTLELGKHDDGEDEVVEVTRAAAFNDHITSLCAELARCSAAFDLAGLKDLLLRADGVGLEAPQRREAVTCIELAGSLLQELATVVRGEDKSAPCDIAKLRDLLDTAAKMKVGGKEVEVTPYKIIMQENISISDFLHTYDFLV